MGLWHKGGRTGSLGGSHVSISAAGSPVMPSDIAILLAVPSGRIVSGGPFALAWSMTLVTAPSPPAMTRFLRVQVFSAMSKRIPPESLHDSVWAKPAQDNYESGHLHRIAGRSLGDHIAAMRRYWNAVADL